MTIYGLIRENLGKQALDPWMYPNLDWDTYPNLNGPIHTAINSEIRWYQLDVYMRVHASIQAELEPPTQ